MYCDFFGFSEKPFTITPNPHFVFLSSIHREAFARLLYGVDSHAGFITLTGEVGTGKTTMLRTLLAQLEPEKYTSALIFNPCVSGEHLLSGICREFGVEAEEKSRSGYLDVLNRFLLEQNTAGRTVVLVIDEAQNLEPEVLEQVRLISNLETARDKLIQIILAGQPELNDVLRRHDLRQLNQRITVRSRLTVMKIDDVAKYINHRLKLSGSHIPGIFSPAAIKRIYRFSCGNPRLINVACEQALVMAWTLETRSVSSSMAAEVIAELKSADKPEGFIIRIVRRLFAGK
ncbi:MAG: AAA family ATPase [Desulfuromonadaceae bacterium]|nr:AAA family ATPase [Desulfuromonadaceae bacterium]MDD2847577.1 AAA family ATPase [Desulfuromonadaceae bacterium]MDD4131178.1 AAA family ATPase [Desulfuromonadaceae bacterium]